MGFFSKIGKAFKSVVTAPVKAVGSLFGMSQPQPLPSLPKAPPPRKMTTEEKYRVGRHLKNYIDRFLSAPEHFLSIEGMGGMNRFMKKYGVHGQLTEASRVIREATKKYEAGDKGGAKRMQHNATQLLAKAYADTQRAGDDWRVSLQST